MALNYVVFKRLKCQLIYDNLKQPFDHKNQRSKPPSHEFVRDTSVTNGGGGGDRACGRREKVGFCLEKKAPRGEYGYSLGSIACLRRTQVAPFPLPLILIQLFAVQRWKGFFPLINMGTKRNIIAIRILKKDFIYRLVSLMFCTSMCICCNDQCLCFRDDQNFATHHHYFIVSSIQATGFLPSSTLFIWGGG